MSRVQPRRTALGDFDVITGPPAPPASLQKPAEPVSPAEPQAPDPTQAPAVSGRQ